MGTVWRVRYAAGAGDDARGHRAAIVARLDDLVAQLSHWSPVSALSAYNRAPAGSWTAMPPDLAHVVGASMTLAAATGGAVDPAIGALVDLWGHGPPGPMPPPTHADVAAAHTASGFRRLRREGDRLYQPGGLRLDLSGIAKGHAADALADLLASRGVRHALVEVGGELAGHGLRPDGDPWWVELEAPPGAALAPLRIALHAAGTATSGCYVRGAHTLDPRTGRPVTNGVIAVSVVAGTAMLADALATAAHVLYPDLSAIERRRVAARFVVADPAGGCREVLTRAMAGMIDPDVA